MYYFYFDASALVKRYTEETGSDKVDYLFPNVPLNQLKCLTIGAAEVFWICVRKKNDGPITPYEFTHAVANLNREVTSDISDFRTDSVPDALVWASLNLVETYFLNSNEYLNEIKELNSEFVEDSSPSFLFFLEMVPRSPDMYLYPPLQGWEVDLSP